MEEPMPETVVGSAQNVPLRIGRVSFEGFRHTSPDLFKPAVESLLEAETFGDVLERLQEAEGHIRRLGVFKDVSFSLDTSEGRPGEADVTVHVDEKGRFELRGETQVGQQEGDLIISGKILNAFGRAEVISGTYSAGTRTASSYQLSFTKPLANPNTAFDVSVFKTTHDFTSFNSHVELNRGFSGNLKVFTRFAEHILNYTAVWRELDAAGHAQSWPVRKEMGHSLKSSVSHSLVRDTRDNRATPSSGYTVSATQEYSGLGGDVKFVKNTVEAQAATKLPLGGLVCSAAAQAGLMYPLAGSRSHISDRFFLGGPMSVRGFSMRGAGPRVGGDSLGGDMQWAAGVSMRTPVWGLRQRIGDWLQLQAWANAGNLAAYDTAQSFKSNVSRLLAEPLRASYGGGLVLNLGAARLEANYCIPLSSAPGDSVKRGLQIGLGISFL